MTKPNKTLPWIDLDGTHGVWLGRLPSELQWPSATFEQCWSLHPDEFHKVQMFGRLVAVPRWSQSYGRDYRYSGTLHRAVPTPALLAPLLQWSQTQIDARLNALLLNWYDGTRGHRIGPHRDDEKELMADAPIVTISFGDTRTFRLKRWRGTDRHDVEVTDGSVLVLPPATNLAFTHEVPASKRQLGRRISVTVRAFSA